MRSPHVLCSSHGFCCRAWKCALCQILGRASRVETNTPYHDVAQPRNWIPNWHEDLHGQPPGPIRVLAYTGDTDVFEPIWYAPHA